LEERVRFETLLAETSAGFVNLPADQIDGEIEGAQRRICELLDLDRSALWQVPEGKPGTLLMTHVHQPQGGPPIPKRPYSRDLSPWAAQKVLSGETVTIKEWLGDADRVKGNPTDNGAAKPPARSWKR